MQNTFFRVDTLTDRGVDLSHRQGKPGKALTDRRDGPGEYLSPNDLCELNYTRGQCLHIAVSVSSVHRLPVSARMRARRNFTFGQ